MPTLLDGAVGLAGAGSSRRRSLLPRTALTSSKVMRGVVRTDVFHAAPAVFQLHGRSPIEVPRGAPLLDVVAVPRAIASAETLIQKKL